MHWVPFTEPLLTLLVQTQMSKQGVFTKNTNTFYLNFRKFANFSYSEKLRKLPKIISFQDLRVFAGVLRFFAGVLRVILGVANQKNSQSTSILPKNGFIFKRALFDASLCQHGRFALVFHRGPFVKHLNATERTQKYLFRNGAKCR